MWRLPGCTPDEILAARRFAAHVHHQQQQHHHQRNAVAVSKLQHAAATMIYNGIFFCQFRNDTEFYNQIGQILRLGFTWKKSIIS